MNKVSKYKSYTELCTKRATLLFTADRLEREMTENRRIAALTLDKILVQQAEHPEYKEQYFEKYISSLKSSQIDPEKAPLVKYMHPDVLIPAQ